MTARWPLRWAAIGALALVAAGALPMAAAPAGAELPTPSTYVIGDSLARQTYESAGWFVDAADGRSLAASTRRILTTIFKRPNATVVVALGSNDVASRSRTMAADIREVTGAGAACLVLTTVKVNGVTGFYAQGRWAQWARRWNREVWRSGAHVANWTAPARAHPQWFRADGLHLTSAGEQAYDQFLRDAVAQHCAT